jgi:UDP-N-acetylglucosamine acyltransferase
VSVQGPSVFGADNVFYHGGSVGERTQDLKYREEPTRLEVGDGNCFREFVTVHRATMPGGVTRIGNRGNFLAYSHVAHDCLVGDDVIFSNNGTLAGHVEVGNRAIIGGLSAIHQFCRIGAHAIIGGCTKVVQDVPPYFVADGNPAAPRAVNLVGLERAGFSKDTIRDIKAAYRTLYRSNLNTTQAMEKLRAGDPVPEVRILADFVESSQRGIIR